MSVSPTFAIREEFDVMVVGNEDEWVVAGDAVIADNKNNNNKSSSNNNNGTKENDNRSPLIPSDSPNSKNEHRIRLLDYVVCILVVVSVQHHQIMKFYFYIFLIRYFETLYTFKSSSFTS